MAKDSETEIDEKLNDLIKRASDGADYLSESNSSLSNSINASNQQFAQTKVEDLNLEQAQKLVERYSNIEADVPVDATRKSKAFSKKILKRMFGWYGHHMAVQTSLLGTSVARFDQEVVKELSRLQAQIDELQKEVQSLRKKS